MWICACNCKHIWAVLQSWPGGRQALFQACVEAGSAARDVGRAEYERLRSAALWWLHTHPQVRTFFLLAGRTPCAAHLLSSGMVDPAGWSQASQGM